MCLKYYCRYDKLCRPWSDAAWCGVWSWSTLFAKAYLSQLCLRLLESYLLMHLKYYWMDTKKWIPWSDAAFCSIWSGYTLFACACLLELCLANMVDTPLTRCMHFFACPRLKSKCWCNTEVGNDKSSCDRLMVNIFLCLSYYFRWIDYHFLRSNLPRFFETGSV